MHKDGHEVTHFRYYTFSGSCTVWNIVITWYKHWSSIMLINTYTSVITNCNSRPEFFLQSSRIRVDRLSYESKTTDKREQYDWRADKNLDGFGSQCQMIFASAAKTGKRDAQSLLRILEGKHARNTQKTEMHKKVALDPLMLPQRWS